jgi:hypothetical protein
MAAVESMTVNKPPPPPVICYSTPFDCLRCTLSLLHPLVVVVVRLPLGQPPPDRWMVSRPELLNWDMFLCLLHPSRHMAVHRARLYLLLLSWEPYRSHLLGLLLQFRVFVCHPYYEKLAGAHNYHVQMVSQRHLIVHMICDGLLYRVMLYTHSSRLVLDLQLVSTLASIHRRLACNHHTRLPQCKKVLLEILQTASWSASRNLIRVSML